MIPFECILTDAEFNERLLAHHRFAIKNSMDSEDPEQPWLSCTCVDDVWDRFTIGGPVLQFDEDYKHKAMLGTGYTMGCCDKNVLAVFLSSFGWALTLDEKEWATPPTPSEDSRSKPVLMVAGMSLAGKVNMITTKLISDQPLRPDSRWQNVRIGEVLTHSKADGKNESNLLKHFWQGYYVGRFRHHQNAVEKIPSHVREFLKSSTFQMVEIDL